MATKRARRPKPKPESEPEPVTYELPPLFWPDDADPEPTRCPVELVYVARLARDGTKEEIEAVPADELADLATFKERYPPGLYYLVGRDFAGRIASRKKLRVGELEREGEHEADAAPTNGQPAPQSPGLSKVLEMLIVNQLQLQQQFGSAQQAHTQQIVEAITTLAGARLADQESMIKALVAGVGKGGGGGVSGKDLLQAYQAGMAQIQDFLDAAGDSEGQDDVGSLIRSFTDGVRAVKGEGAPANDNAPAPERRPS